MIIKGYWLTLISFPHTHTHNFTSHTTWVMPCVCRCPVCVQLLLESLWTAFLPPLSTWNFSGKNTQSALSFPSQRITPTQLDQSMYLVSYTGKQVLCPAFYLQPELCHTFSKLIINIAIHYSYVNSILLSLKSILLESIFF